MVKALLLYFLIKFKIPFIWTQYVHIFTYYYCFYWCIILIHKLVRLIQAQSQRGGSQPPPNFLTFWKKLIETSKCSKFCLCFSFFLIHDPPQYVKLGLHLPWTNNFCRPNVIWKHPNTGLLFCFRFIGINLGFVTCYDIVHMFWGTWVEFFKIFRAPFHTSVLFSLR